MKINRKRDAHVHTNFSPDADPNATFNAYIEEANNKGIEEIIFTDHFDLDPAHPLFETPIDYETYFENYNNRKKVDGVTTKVGIEIGYQPHTINETMKLIEKYSFEYVILSIHYIDKKDLFTKEYFKGKTKYEAYYRYFEVCLEAIKNTPIFDAFGHLDYIPRYSELGDFEYEDYKELIDEILIELVNRNKILEINTSGYVSNKRPYPSKRIVKRFIELGGQEVYMGSDSHKVNELARCFDLPLVD